MNINTEEYWEQRFKMKDWKLYGGNDQTKFFADIAIQNFPRWLIEDIRRKEMSIIDVGCAEGDGTFALKKVFSRSIVDGIDFSLSAIEEANKKYPSCNFYCRDIESLSNKYDVIFSSNVLEHITDPFPLLKTLLKNVDKYCIFLLPFQEKELHKEHVNYFDYNSFKIFEGSFFLSYYKVIDCSVLNTPFWEGKQLLLVYINREYIDETILTLSDTHNYDFEELEHMRNENDSMTKVIQERNEKYEQLNMEKQNIEKCLMEEKSFSEKLQGLNLTLESEKTELENKNFKLEEKYKLLDEKHKLLEKENFTLEEKILNFERNNEILSLQLNELSLKNDNKEMIYCNQIEYLSTENEKIKKENLFDKKLIDSYENTIQDAEDYIYALVSTKLFKLVHLFVRIKRQLFLGSFEEKKDFFHWLIRRNQGIANTDRRYNPMFGIISILNQKKEIFLQEDEKENFVVHSKLFDHLEKQHRILTASLEKKQHSDNVRKIKNIIEQHHNDKIMIYPHVVHWEPLQTPQQLLLSLSKRGWLCFFCEHESFEVNVNEIESNLYLVKESELVCALQDKHIFLLLTWLGSMSFINKLPQKTIWYHILDDLSIFPYYDEYYLEMNSSVIKDSQVVTYVSKNLVKYLNGRTAFYLPNAVNTGTFFNIQEDYIPDDMKGIIQKNKKIIGYFGYIAEWFDYDLLRNIALQRKQYEFVLIGGVLCEKINLLKGIENVHILGLKKYRELSNYAKFFDVAIIPFEISEKMDGVSPIKFYEYCSLGIPVISTKMDELIQYETNFIKCINNKEEFLFYLDKFVSTEISKEEREKIRSIAYKNQWQNRAEKIEHELIKVQNRNINTEYSKYDVIILSVIDFDFRHQRPQHIAEKFSEKNHRVFYINANHFSKEGVQSLNPYLNIVNFNNEKVHSIHLSDWRNELDNLYSKLDKLISEYYIGDAVVIVDYPNWHFAAKYLREKYGFNYIVDYMDDFTGFLNPAEKLVSANSVQILKESDYIIASSTFLYDIANKYNQCVELIRNGTEFEHFNNADGKIIKVNEKRKIIGYYGAIAHWFDFEIVYSLAENFPEADIHLIGEVSEKNRFSDYENIKLLGEKKYEELPKYLKEFDVCIIPFDSSIDLIKATNPVKFYEYLSAGKKIVATDIPELREFKDRFVYLSNDKEGFNYYVKQCLDNEDTLASREERIAFAKSQDWKDRFNKFEKVVSDVFPSVEVVILSYNNKKITQICYERLVKYTAYPNYTITIVDNNSMDGTTDYLKTIDNKNVKIILNDENRGFAGGNNVALQQSVADYVVLLNNDTLVTRGWLTNLVKHMENDSTLGMCGPVTNSIGNESKIKVNYNSIEEINKFAFEYAQSHMGNLYIEVNVLALFCTIIRKSVIEECGMLDENYRVGMFEDDDYSEKVKQSGYKIAIAEDSFIHHFEGVSFGKLQDKEFLKVYNANKAYFQNKWNKEWKLHEFRKGVNCDTNHELNKNIRIEVGLEGDKN